MQYAPIIIFAFNRIEPLKQIVASLLKNTEAADSDLFVFVDGARDNKEGEKEKVLAVREYVKTIKGFNSVHFTFSEKNYGLGPSIISGVTKVINQYGRVIVLEDDLLISHNCLSFLNQGLDKYENSKQVFSVCGWTPIVTKPKDYKLDSYFCVRSSSWGWATWSDRWNSVDWELDDWSAVALNHRTFNKWGGSDCYGMLKGWKTGINRSWAIRFVYSQFVQNKVALFPTECKIDNYGFDGTGTDCGKYCRAKWHFIDSSNKKFLFPDRYEINSSILKQVMSSRTIIKRIKSRVTNNVIQYLPNKLVRLIINNF